MINWRKKKQMTIEIKLVEEYDPIRNNLNENILALEDIEENTSIKQESLNQIYNLLNNNELKILCRNIIQNKYLNKFTYEDLNNMYDTLKDFFENIKDIKERIDVDQFFQNGNMINIEKLKEEFYKYKIDKKFPNFNFQRLKELFENPPKKLKALDNSSGEYIQYDPFIIRKYLYGIIQMAINEMDLLIGFTGAEGMGKSCACSQDMNLIYYLLKELELITYDYNIKNMWFSSLSNFLAAEDKYFGQPFRILGLDEGNELNRQDWQNEDVKTFFQRLRRERKEQRIKFICLPQLGELITAIVLSRMNFIFNSYSKDKIETGTLDKGFCNFYIIPRNAKIYSHHHKKELTKEEIVDILGINLDDKKKYLKEIPKSIIIKRFKRNYIWGFNKKDYDKYIKEANKTFSVAKGIRVTEYQAYLYYLSAPNVKDWNTESMDKSQIRTIQGLHKAIRRVFEIDPDKVKKYELLLENKERRKTKDI